VRTRRNEPETIVWQEPSTWLNVVGSFVAPRLGSGRLSAFRRRTDLGSLYADDSEWQAFLETALVQDFDQISEEFADHLEPFNVDVFHACRPLDVAEYLANGLFTASWERREERLHRLIRELAITQEEQERILGAFRSEKLERDIDIGALFLALDARHLVDSCGHYLILGSEWIASQLGADYYAGLRAVGIPTVLRIKLPLAWPSIGDRKSLAADLLREWVRLTALEDNSAREIDFTFRIRRAIPAGLVVSHSHPSEIPDPHHPDGWGTVWKNPHTTCPYCA
jgi:hypothetical protein